MVGFQKIPQSVLREDRPRRVYYLVYTFAFCCTALLVFSWVIASGRTLIWQSDGWTQHYAALVWYGKYLRSIVRTLLHSHVICLPDYDFYISEGADILTTMHYYVVGDPLNLLAVFFSTSKMYWLYDGLIVLRLYLAGLTFSFLCFETSQKNRQGILAGALSYAFCYWAMLNSARHPFFLTPMIYAPLLILGVEKEIAARRNEKPWLLPLTVALAAVSNFYFFYQLVLLTMLYAVLRAVSVYGKDVKQLFLAGIRVAIPSAIGVLLAGFLFLPVLNIFLSDARFSGGENKWYFLYPWKYYSSLPSLVIVARDSFWLCIGVTVPAMLAVVLLLVQKKSSRFLKWLLAACAILVIVPVCGQVLNGMSYRANRWSFMAGLLFCYILTVKWEDMLRISGRDSGILLAVLAGYWALCMLLEASRTMTLFSCLCLAFAVVGILMMPVGHLKYREGALMLLVIANIVANAFWHFSDGGTAYVQQCMEVSQVREEFLNNEVRALETVGHEEFARYSGYNISHNRSFLQGVSSTSYFWTLTNPRVTQFRKDMDLKDNMVHSFTGYDDRASLLSLSATNYYLTNDSSSVPYGFHLVDYVDVQEERTERRKQELKEALGTEELTDGQIRAIEKSSRSVWGVYVNENSLPLGYCYDQYFTQAHWDSLTALERQQAMLTSVCLSEDSSAGTKVAPREDVESIPYDVTCHGDDITYDNGRIVTTASNTKLTLAFEGSEASETYLEITGLNFDGTDKFDLYFGDSTVDPQNLYNKVNWELLSDKERSAIRKSHYSYVDPTSVTLQCWTSDNRSNKLVHYSPEHSFYHDKHDYLIHFGYYDESCRSITLTFPTPGVYTFSSLKVCSVPMADFSGKIDDLRKNTLENIEFGTDTLRGTVEIDAPKILCIAIPYNQGWTAQVDGKAVKIMVANGHYIGIDLPAGQHTVMLKYSTPLKTVGMVSTCVGVLLLGVYLYLLRKKKAL